MEHFDNNVFAQIQDDLRVVPSYAQENTNKNHTSFYFYNALYGGLIFLGVSFWFIDIRAFLSSVLSAETVQAITPFLNTGIHYSFASMLVVLCLILLYLNIRRHYSGTHFWGTSCPECQNSELIRYKRTRWQRLSGTLLQLPIRHYGCKRCDWSGGRIDRGIFQ